MPRLPTGAERYFANRMEDSEYRRAYEEARRRIDRADSIVRRCRAARSRTASGMEDRG